MFRGLKPSFVKESVENELKKELFNDNGFSIIKEEDIFEISKNKKPKKFNSFPDFNVYEIGYTGVVYKVFIAFDKRSSRLALFGYLDANSSHPVLVHNMEIPSNQMSNYSSFLNHGGRVKSGPFSWFNGIEGFLAIVENYSES
jgi:hypothetical protein